MNQDTRELGAQVLETDRAEIERLEGQPAACNAKLPGQVAPKGEGLEIMYESADCALGRVLVGATAEGVCAVLLGENDEQLQDQLREQFPAAEVRGDRLPGNWMVGVLEHISNTHLPLAVPLDFRGTPFQVRVWKALREVPAGERRTYSEIARAIGSDRAVRAVGTACGQNSIAVLIPCHRIARKDGRLGGYRWGVARKRALLAAEQKSAARSSVPSLLPFGADSCPR